MHAFACAPALD